jgi:rfaE bifunctional protein kinase chain/domain
MHAQRLQAILDGFDDAVIGVVGDFCVDAYWALDRGKPEISIETDQPTHGVRSQRYSLGGAGNVVANLAALGSGSIHAFGVVGDDVFGREMNAMLGAAGVVCEGIVVQKSGWDTSVYAKPYLREVEQNRIDFGRFNRMRQTTTKRLMDAIEKAVTEMDVLIVNQQIAAGVHSGALIEFLNTLAKTSDRCQFVLDARHKGEQFDHMIFKLNSIEAAALCGEEHEIARAVTVEDVERYARTIWKRTQKSVVISRGSRGIAGFDGDAFFSIPGIQILERVDAVGAGDTVAAALSASLAAGANLREAAEVANAAASIVVRKLQQTGAASRDEIMEVGTDTDFIYLPECAEDIRRARYLTGTRAEIISEGIQRGQIQHVVFDHDGTISTLRQGWEAIMVPVMMKAVLGESYEGASEEDYYRVSQRVEDYIDKSTGIQTIVQMQGLVEIVAEFGFVPEADILDAAGYKEIYNDALMARIRERMQFLEAGELDVTDYTVKGAVDFLHALEEKGVVLYLASGTDEGDVREEAGALGYASCFKGGIFGAVGDIKKYSKKMVIARIMKEHGLSGPQLAVFGDGPVELREARKRDGIAVGIASDEIRRYGLNRDKRTRLIQAGADLIVPDFSQGEKLLAYLFGE